MQTILSDAWQLQGDFQVIYKQGKFYVVHFDNEEDREYIHAIGPWAVQDALLISVHWRPNIVLKDFHVLNFPIWVQIWDLPLEYHTLHFVEYLGPIIGLVEWIDWPTNNPRNMRFLRLRVRIRPQSPLFMGFMLKMEDGHYRWFQCKYERLFRFSCQCGRIGHKADTCVWTKQQIRSSIQGLLLQAISTFNLSIGVGMLEDHYVGDGRAFVDHPARITTRIELITVGGNL